MRIRPTSEQWEKARADHEVRGTSLGEISRRLGVSRQAVYKQARKNGWEQGKSYPLVEKKVKAIKEIAEVEAESCQLPSTFRQTLDEAVKERLEIEGMLVRFDMALIEKGAEVLKGVKRPEQWETMTRGRRNLSGESRQGPLATVNVNQGQSQQAGAAVLPPPRPESSQTIREALWGAFAGDS